MVGTEVDGDASPGDGVMLGGVVLGGVVFATGASGFTLGNGTGDVPSFATKGWSLGGKHPVLLQA